MSYLYARWNSFRLKVCPPTFPTLEHGLRCAGHSRSEDLRRRRRRRAWLVAEGAAGTDHWANLVRAGITVQLSGCANGNFHVPSRISARGRNRRTV